MKVFSVSNLFSISIQSIKVHSALVRPFLPSCVFPAGHSPFLPTADNTQTPPCPQRTQVQCVRATDLSLHLEMILAKLRFVVPSFIDLSLGTVWDTQVGIVQAGA